MQREYFINKSYCELGIVSQEIDPKTISALLNLEPFISYSKGDTFSSKHTGRVGKRFQNLWSIRSKTIVSEKEDLSLHISYFKSLLGNKMKAISEIKNNPIYEISFWIWIETDDTGIGIDLSNEDIIFINSISNRVHFSIITNHKIEE
ncbi:MAG: hypothetical protein HJHJAOHD_02532 [Flavobacteriales bacterium]|nr:hypothetical protein [Flavobacteriales bacterium]